MTTTTKPITTETALAAALGVTTKTLRAWRERFPHAPAGKDLGEWRVFVEQEGLGITNNRVSADREFWLTKAAKYRARLLELEEQRERGELMLKTDVDARDFKIASTQKTKLYELLTVEIPIKAEGLTATEIRKLLQDACDQVCDVMAELADLRA